MAEYEYYIAEYWGRPKCRLWTFIAVLWLPIAFIGSMCIDQQLEGTFRDWQWAIWLPGAIELIFTAVAIYLRFTEKPRRIIEHHVAE